MNIEFVVESMKENYDRVAIVSDGVEYGFQSIHQEYRESMVFLEKNIERHSVVSLVAEFSPKSIAMFLALISLDCILVPISRTLKRTDHYISISESEYLVELTNEEATIKRIKGFVKHEMLLKLKESKQPGLILFSSGTTGEPKAALHNMELLMEKFKKPGKTLRTITFLLFDHIGGFNTMMHALANGGTIVTLKSRSPEEVCRLIEQNKVELLPASPTFLNMILMSRTYEKYDLSSLKIISYGTESMPEHTLNEMCRLFPGIKFKQTYGLSEIGIMATKSKDSNSLWMKVGGEGFETKIVDDILYVRAKSAMMGYLNAPSPFDEEGWFNTKDKVELEGGYIKILGRVTDIINVGGEKVYPIEIESTLLQYEGVLDARAYSEDNALVGKSVTAKVKVAKENHNREFIKKLRSHCKDRLERFKIPSKFILSEEDLCGERLKKKRR